MRKSYFINIDGGNGEYHLSKRDANKAYNVEREDDVTGEKKLPLSLELHILTKDCFERAYNGGGGFVESVTVLKTREEAK